MKRTRGLAYKLTGHPELSACAGLNVQRLEDLAQHRVLDLCIHEVLFLSELGLERDVAVEILDELLCPGAPSLKDVLFAMDRDQEVRDIVNDVGERRDIAADRSILVLDNWMFLVRHCRKCRGQDSDEEAREEEESAEREERVKRNGRKRSESVN